MNNRKLRMAWSVFWSLAAVLLIVLWVRSYWKIDFVNAPIPVAAQLSSGNGTVGFLHLNAPSQSWNIVTVSMAEVAAQLEARGRSPLASHRDSLFHFETKPGYVAISFLYPLLGLGAVAGIPWIRWQFSLRTLLIAITAVGVVLGLIVWALR